jgi:hypothetical protein
MKSQCLIDTTNFIKIKNHVNHLKENLHFLIHNFTFFATNILWNHTIQVGKKKILFDWILCAMVYHIMQNVWKNMLKNYDGWSSNMDTLEK